MSPAEPENGDDYAGQDPINGYDLDGRTTCGPGECVFNQTRHLRGSARQRLISLTLGILDYLKIPQPTGTFEIENFPGEGIVLREPGTTGNASTLRIFIKGSHNPEGYVRFYNRTGQAIDPRTGRPPGNVTRQEFQRLTHISMNYRGPWKGLPSFFTR